MLFSTIFDQDDEMDYNDSRRFHRCFEEDLEVEARAEKRITNAKNVLSLLLLEKIPRFNLLL